MVNKPLIRPYFLGGGSFGGGQLGFPWLFKERNQRATRTNCRWCRYQLARWWIRRDHGVMMGIRFFRTLQSWLRSQRRWTVMMDWIQTTLRGTNISHVVRRKTIFKSPLGRDILDSRRVVAIVAMLNGLNRRIELADMDVSMKLLGVFFPNEDSDQMVWYGMYIYIYHSLSIYLYLNKHYIYIY